jgi:hypothetical protein
MGRLEQVEDEVIDVAVADAHRVRLAKSLHVRRKGIGRQPARFEPRLEGAKVGPRDACARSALRNESASRRQRRTDGEHREGDTHGGRMMSKRPVRCPDWGGRRPSIEPASPEAQKISRKPS